MADKSCFETERTRLFSALLDTVWQGKKVWEHIRDKDNDHALCATPAFEGELYHSSKTKIMFVGRDLNGWTEPLGDCSTLENTVYSITHQDEKYVFSTLVNSEGVVQENGGRKYYHKNSKFFRFIKHVLEYCGESESDINKTWYNDPMHWNQRFVWANLFCIAPRNPNKEKRIPMHANDRLLELGLQHYIDLMRLYISHYEPDVVVFITDVKGWFIPWEGKAAFSDIVENYKENPSEDVIVATGKIYNSHIVVCKRPDKRGMTHENVQAMAKAVSCHIQQVLQK